MELDEHERRVVDLIGKHGWTVMKISPNAGDSAPRWFAYTVGLTLTHRWPELICFGLSLDVMTNMLENAVRELKGIGSAPFAGQTLSEVIEKFPVRLENFPHRHFQSHLGWAAWFANRHDIARKDFHCLQMIWPDKAGHFPSDADCAAGVRECQTPSDEPN